MTKTFTALTGALIILVCSSGAWAQMDAGSGAQPPQQIASRTKTGPIAFGFIGKDGTISSGSGNFTVKHRGQRYEIKIKRVDYFYESYSTGVTPSIPDSAYCSTDSFGGRLTVNCYDASGAAVKAAFAFVVY